MGTGAKTMNQISNVRNQYANRVAVHITLFDISLGFGLDLGEHREEQETHIMLSPQRAKCLLQMLSEKIEEYEASFGEIHITATPKLIEEVAASMK